MEKRNERLEILEDVHEMLTEAIKLVANEPSVGLYFVQQHVQKSVPALVNLKDQLLETTADAELATADAKDSLSCIKTMKECGPPVIERMINTLKAASDTIPTSRLTRGSVSQLLPRPVRPIGLGKSHLRSSSFLGDWNSDTSTSKISESLEKSTKLSGDLLNKEYKQKAVINGKADLPRTRTTDLDRQEKNMSDGFDSSDIAITKESSLLETLSSSEPTYDNVKGLLSSAISKAGSVGRDGVKLIRERVSQSVRSNGRVNELESTPSRLVIENEALRSEDVSHMQVNFEEFQAHHKAKLESWLTEE